MALSPSNKIAAAGSSLYLLAVGCASIYPLLDRRTFSGLAAVLLAWPGLDYFPSRLLPLAVGLNAAVIYVLVFSIHRFYRLVRRSPN